jgi:hypothetical protein
MTISEEFVIDIQRKSKLGNISSETKEYLNR